MESFILKLVWKCKRPRKQNNLRKENLEDLHYLISRLTVTTAVNTVYYWPKYRQINQYNRIRESRDRTTHLDIWIN